MANITVTSKQFRLDSKDFWKGLLFAVLGGIVGVLETTVFDEHFNWTPVWVAGASAGIVYFVTQYVSPAAVIKEIPNDQVESMKMAVDKGLVDIVAR